MIWIVVSAIAVAFISSWLGYKRLLYLDQVTFRNLSYALIGVLAVFLGLEWLHRFGYFPQDVAAATMAGVYSSIFGFFAGAAVQQFNQKQASADILYIHRSFWTDIFPNIASIALIVFGIYRTSLMSDLPVTPIRMTSGLSLIAIGFWGFTIRLVPEFRNKGIILLDRKIDWDSFVTYSWFEEVVLEIEYKQNGKIKSFKTMIPEEDHVLIENVLKRKMAEKIEEENVES